MQEASLCTRPLARNGRPSLPMIANNKIQKRLIAIMKKIIKKIIKKLIPIIHWQVAIIKRLIPIIDTLIFIISYYWDPMIANNRQ